MAIDSSLESSSRGAKIEFHEIVLSCNGSHGVDYVANFECCSKDAVNYCSSVYEGCES